MCRFQSSRAVLVLFGLVALSVCRAAADESSADEFSQATEAYRAQDWELAQRRFLDFLERHPKENAADEAEFRLAEVRMQLGAHREARTGYERFLATASDQPHASIVRAQFRRGQASYLLREWERAATELDDFLAAHEQDLLAPVAHLLRAEIATRTRDWEQAEIHFRAGLSQFPPGPNRAACQLGLGLVAEGRDQPAKAIEHYQIVANNDHPEAARACYLLVRRYLQDGDRARAEEVAGGLRERFPESPYLATVADLFRGEAKPDPPSRVAADYQSRWQALEQQADDERVVSECVALIAEAATDRPIVGPAWTIAARCACRTSRPEEARRILEAVRDLEFAGELKAETAATWELAEIYAATGYEEFALRELARIRQLDTTPAIQAASWKRTQELRAANVAVPARRDGSQRPAMPAHSTTQASAPRHSPMRQHAGAAIVAVTLPRDGSQRPAMPARMTTYSSVPRLTGDST